MGDRAIRRTTEPRITGTSDKKFHDFPRPTVAADTALLTIDPDRRQLQVVEMAREDSGKWALPGTFLRERETLAEAVERCLRDKIGVQGVRPQQLGVFDDPDRDDRDWVISVAHVAVVRPEQLESLGTGAAYETRLAPVDRPGELAWDHPRIVRLAKEHVRSRYQAEPDPDRLLGRRFTLSELQRVHEAVAGSQIDRHAFRRAMEDHVVGTGVFNEHTGQRGRPAEFFRRKRDGE
jgi:8-oxo-dGTP diphosphatase